MNGYVLLFVGLALSLSAAAALAQRAPVSLWPVDPLEKVFRDTLPPAQAEGSIRIRCARNEIESGQFAIRAGLALERVQVKISPLRHVTEAAFLSEEQIRWRMVGFVPVRKNSPDTPDSELLRKAPFQAPDPLLEDRSFGLKPGQTQPIWLTVSIPERAIPGEYRGTVTVDTPRGQAEVPIEVSVYPFALPNARHLFVTNWFNLQAIARAHSVDLWSEEFWQALGRYAQNMAAHRQNVVLTPLSLVAVYREEDGRLAFDFSRFDRYVRLFEKAGAAQRIELSHLGGFGEGGWASKTIQLHPLSAVERKTGETLALPPQESLPPFLKAVEQHLAQNGWLEKSCIHVTDEPAEHNRLSWLEASRFIRQAAPRLKQIDAIETTGFGRSLDVWVPKLNHLNHWLEEYQAAEADGAELWFYTCCHPTGYYPNRFTDYSLVKTRLLHWLNWRYNLTGYLHWGLNFWTANPFDDLNDTALPPGDSFIIYPGSAGPLDSIRWEAMRDGLEDFEYLWLLQDAFASAVKKLGNPSLPARARSDELCRLLVHSITDYERDPARLNDIRHRIAQEIVALSALPALLVTTSPPAGSEVVSGPISLIVRGAAEPGTSVTVNGQAVDLNMSGTFSIQTWPEGGKVTVTAEKDGQKKTVEREFRVRGGKP
ncbi:MAG: DUF4091 domain-containing protein [Armatimonadetes bacterium]|nr:DUF4091 domain-containing protein [Armatimonadota bacterium]